MTAKALIVAEKSDKKQMQKNKHLKNQDGASAVEFAILLPLLLILLFGIIEFSLYIFNRQVITNAVREATRAGIVVQIPRLSDAEIESLVQNYTGSKLVTFGSGSLVMLPVLREDPTGNPLGNDSTGNPILGHFGDVLKVRATFQYDFLFLANLGIGPATIQVISQMRFE